MEYNILPWARNENKDLAYVLREASELAIHDGDIPSANDFLVEGEKLCDRMGTLHTKNRIIQIRQHISSINVM